MCISSKIFEVRFVVGVKNGDKFEQSYEIKSLPFSRNEINNFLNSYHDELYIVIDLTKKYAHKITDKVDLTFAFNSSYPLLENHFLLGTISKNRFKILDKAISSIFIA